MAELKDFFREGAETLADITINAGELINGERYEIDFVDPVNPALDVTVIEKRGQTGGRNEPWMQRERFDVRKAQPKIRFDRMYSVAGEAQDLNIVLERTPTDTNSTQNYTDWRTVARPAGGTFGNTYDEYSGGYFIDTVTGKQFAISGTVTAGATQEDGAGLRYTLDPADLLNGKVMSYSTNQFNSDSLKGLYFAQSGFERYRWNYFLDQTWMSGVNRADVVFYVGMSGNGVGYTNYIIGQCVDIDAANDRVKGITQTSGNPNLTTQPWNSPYDVHGTALAANYEGVRHITNGYKITKTTSSGTGGGTGVDINLTGSTLTWSASPTAGSGINDDFNHIGGAVIKFHDGSGDFTDNFGICTVYTPNSTTSSSVTTITSIGNYAGATSGNFANYEIWLWYDPSVDNGYSDIPLWTLNSGDWNYYDGGRWYTTYGTTSTNYRGAWYSPNVDNFTKRTGVMVQTLERDCNQRAGGIDVADNARRIMITEFDGMVKRDGTVISGGITIRPNEFITTDWNDGFYSPNGTDWYKSVKNKDAIRNNFNAVGDFDNTDQWFIRKCVQWSGSEWQINDFTGGLTSSDDRKNTDAATYKAAYEGENWVNTGITDPNAWSEAIGAWNNGYYNTWDMPQEFEYNTRYGVNTTDSDITIQYYAEQGYGDDGAYEFALGGLKKGTQGLWSTLGHYPTGADTSGTNSAGTFHDAVRWVFSSDMTKMYLDIGPSTIDVISYMEDTLTFNDLRVIVKGSKA
jgi:hypothetical protein